MQGHHFNNLANKRNRVPEEANNSGMLPAPTVVSYQGPSQMQPPQGGQPQFVGGVGGVSMALTGQRIVGAQRQIPGMSYDAQGLPMLP